MGKVEGRQDLGPRERLAGALGTDTDPRAPALPTALLLLAGRGRLLCCYSHSIFLSAALEHSQHTHTTPEETFNSLTVTSQVWTKSSSITGILHQVGGEGNNKSVFTAPTHPSSSSPSFCLILRLVRYIWPRHQQGSIEHPELLALSRMKKKKVINIGVFLI